MQEDANIKPVVVLDDDSSTTQTLAKGIRRFAGLPVKYYKSVPAFLRAIDWSDKDGLPALAEKLKAFSAISCDNNFEGQDHEHYSDGWVRGIDFLANQVGPAVISLPESERPYLVSFSPSSLEVIRNNERELWDKYQIACYHRIFEGLGVGIAIRFSREYGVPFSREMLIRGVMGFEKEYPDDFQSPKHDFFIGFQVDHLYEFTIFKGEDMWQVEGDAKDIGWDNLVDAIADGLKIEKDELLHRIEKQAQLLRAQGVEGQTTTTGKERI